jgi:SAM-dependent methyltransferase
VNPSSRLAAVLLLTLVVPWAALAQKAEEKPYEPHLGQPGKDVVWLPTPQALVEKMLDMAKATPRDYVMDLGSGDGRLVIAAAKRGISALGIEYDPNMVALSKRNARQAGVSDKAKFEEADLFETDFRRATVITMFLMPDINLKLRPRILELEPGTRVVSNSFDMGDWEADETAILGLGDGCDGYCTARLWIVPAKVAGKHATAQGELTLEQAFQKVKGTLRSDGNEVPVEGKVVGREVELVAKGRKMRAVIEGGKLALRSAATP